MSAMTLEDLGIPHAKKETLASRVLRGRSTGQHENLCPFGCATDKLDANGYCKHLVGFSKDGKTMEPMVWDRKLGRRVIRVEREKIMTGELEDVDVPYVDEVTRERKVRVETREIWEWGEPKLKPVLPTDIKRLISTDMRIYRGSDDERSGLVRREELTAQQDRLKNMEQQLARLQEQNDQLVAQLTEPKKVG